MTGQTHAFLGLAIVRALLSSGSVSIKKGTQKFLEKEAVLVFTFLEQLEYYDKPCNLLHLLENIVCSISLSLTSVQDLHVIK